MNVCGVYHRDSVSAKSQPPTIFLTVCPISIDCYYHFFWFPKLHFNLPNLNDSSSHLVNTYATIVRAVYCVPAAKVIILQPYFISLSFCWMYCGLRLWIWCAFAVCVRLDLSTIQFNRKQYVGQAFSIKYLVSPLSWHDLKIPYISHFCKTYIVFLLYNT